MSTSALKFFDEPGQASACPILISFPTPGQALVRPFPDNGHIDFETVSVLENGDILMMEDCALARGTQFRGCSGDPFFLHSARFQVGYYGNWERFTAGGFARLKTAMPSVLIPARAQRVSRNAIS